MMRWRDPPGVNKAEIRLHDPPWLVGVPNGRGGVACRNEWAAAKTTNGGSASQANVQLLANTDR